MRAEKTKCRMGNACVIRKGGKPDDECGEFCHFNTKKVKTHYDQIREMSREQLAELFGYIHDDVIVPHPDADCGESCIGNDNCYQCWVEWLDEVAEE